MNAWNIIEKTFKSFNSQHENNQEFQKWKISLKLKSTQSRKIPEGGKLWSDSDFKTSVECERTKGPFGITGSTLDFRPT